MIREIKIGSFNYIGNIERKDGFLFIEAVEKNLHLGAYSLFIKDIEENTKDITELLVPVTKKELNDMLCLVTEDIAKMEETIKEHKFNIKELEKYPEEGYITNSDWYFTKIYLKRIVISIASPYFYLIFTPNESVDVPQEEDNTTSCCLVDKYLDNLIIEEKKKLKDEEFRLAILLQKKNYLEKFIKEVDNTPLSINSKLSKSSKNY